jgi:uncharacterized protein YjdB
MHWSGNKPWEGLMKTKIQKVWTIAFVVGISAGIVMNRGIFLADDAEPSDNVIAGEEISTPGNGTAAGDEMGTSDDDSTTEEVTIVRIRELYKKLAPGVSVSLLEDVTSDVSEQDHFIWTTTNKKYAAVSKEGVVKTKKAGAGKTVTVTAKEMNRSGRRVIFRIDIMNGTVSKVTAKVPQKTVEAGNSITIKTTVKATKGANKKLSFTSSNTKYASVSQKGVVTAYEAGKGKTVKITVAATDGSGKTATVKIKIK